MVNNGNSGKGKFASTGEQLQFLPSPEFQNRWRVAPLEQKQKQEKMILSGLPLLVSPKFSAYFLCPRYSRKRIIIIFKSFSTKKKPFAGNEGEEKRKTAPAASLSVCSLEWTVSFSLRHLANECA